MCFSYILIGVTLRLVYTERFYRATELRSNGDFTPTANRACEQPAILLRFVARQIAALSPQIRTCSKFSSTLLRFYRSSCGAIKSLCVNEPLDIRFFLFPLGNAYSESSLS